MPTKDGNLTKEEKVWIGKFKRLLKTQPKGIELVVDNGGIEIWKAGSHNKHMGSQYDGFGMGTNPKLEVAWLGSIPNGVLIPYSEGQ